MDRDKQLEQQINEFQAIGKENPNVDVGMLVINALQNQRKNLVSPKAKKWAYVIALSIPFAGFVSALAYYMKDEDDAKETAWICVILSFVCLLMLWIGGKLLLSSSGTSLDQIQQIKPSDALQLMQ